MKSDITFAKLSAAFLEWSKANNNPRTFEENSHFAKSFGALIGRSRTVAGIIAHDVTRWLTANPQWHVA